MIVFNPSPGDCSVEDCVSSTNCFLFFDLNLGAVKLLDFLGVLGGLLVISL